jgi:hypothetical protein
MLRHFFGDDNAFELRPAFNNVVPGPPEGGVQPRRYTRISDMAQDGIDARTYGGMHFRGSSRATALVGAQIADYVPATPRDLWPAPTTRIRTDVRQGWPRSGRRTGVDTRSVSGLASAPRSRRLDDRRRYAVVGYHGVDRVDGIHAMTVTRRPVRRPR